MIELKILGGLDLRGPPDRDCRAVLAQPKRLALLAFLALTHQRGFARRDTLVAFFWPELDANHARSALRQTLSFLRRALGDEVLTRRGAEEIGVDEGAFFCDAVAFDRACEAGDLDAAVELYRGDLLQGLYVTDASPDLEHWIDDERARLRHQAAQAAWKLVDRWVAKGNVELAAEHARRALTLFPEDEGGLRRLMALLERLGDHDGALRVYQSFTRRLAAGYDVEPEAETTALMVRVRSRIGGALMRNGAGVSEPEHPGIAGAPRGRPAGAEAVARPLPPPEILSDGDGVAPATSLAPSVREATFTAPREARRFPFPITVAALATLVGLGGVALGLHARGESLRGVAEPPSIAPPTRDQLANDLYLKSRVILNQGTLSGLKTAARHLEQAVQRDSQFARAYGLLALVHTSMPLHGEVAPSDAYPRAQAAAQRALELDPTTAEATGALARVSAYFHWDWKEGDRLFRRSLALRPDDANAHIDYGDFLSATGRLSESIVHFERAKVLDPSSRRAPNNLARRLIWAGQYDRAMAELHSTLELEPNFARGHRTLGILYVQVGRYADAIAELRRACELSGNRAFDLAALADAYVGAGRRAEAEQILAELEERERHAYVPPFAIAVIHASLGRRDEAFAWLDRAADAHDVTLALTVLHESMLDPIRADPRFGALLRRMRLPL